MNLVPYLKSPLSFREQADRLIRRGLIGDKDLIEERLSSVNYYRLSAYWFDFYARGDGGKRIDVFRDGCRFEDAWARYVFDRRLRLYVMDALERMEVDFKTTFVSSLTLKTRDAFAHLRGEYFPKFPILKRGLSQERENVTKKVYTFKEACRQFDAYANKSSEDFVLMHRRKYLGPLPFWKSCEIVPLGTVSILFEGLDSYTKREIATRYGMSGRIFENALRHLCYVRNLCAHHSRLWNRKMAIRYSIPSAKNLSVFHTPNSILNDQMFGTLSLLRYLMRIVAHQSRWSTRFSSLMEEAPSDSLRMMGFPENWKEYELWAE